MKQYKFWKFTEHYFAYFTIAEAREEILEYFPPDYLISVDK